MVRRCANAISKEPPHVVRLHPDEPKPSDDGFLAPQDSCHGRPSAVIPDDEEA
jgi:hypothetical protein